MNAAILTIAHQALAQDSCHSLMDLFDEQEMTEVNHIDANTITSKDETILSPKYEDMNGRIVWTIDPSEPVFDKIWEEIELMIPNSEDFNQVSFMQLIKYPTNSCMPFHMDASDSKDTATALFNLNDNFQGGRLIVDAHIIQPSEGQMVVFNNSTVRWHGVDTVIQGERYVLALWFTDPERFDENGMTEYDTNEENISEVSEAKSFPKVILKQ